MRVDSGLVHEKLLLLTAIIVTIVFVFDSPNGRHCCVFAFRLSTSLLLIVKLLGHLTLILPRDLFEKL